VEKPGLRSFRHFRIQTVTVMHNLFSAVLVQESVSRRIEVAPVNTQGILQ
jgi:hypothetical protein